MSRARHHPGAWAVAFFGLALPLAVPTIDAQETAMAKIKLQSPKLKAGEVIPVDYTGDGRDVSPPLAWSDLPSGTRQLALICDDPDAPTPTPWVHWVIYKIPASAKGLPEGLPRDAELKSPPELAGVLQGPTGWRQPGYRGPAPPRGHGVHHYHFKLYALEAALNLQPGLGKDALLKAIEGHVIGQGELVVTYQR